MNDCADLPLFRWAKEKPATILIFPLSKRVSAVQSVATMLEGMQSSSDANEYWRSLMGSFRAKARGWRIAETVIDKEQDDFHAAVSVELTCRGLRRRRGGGAA